MTNDPSSITDSPAGEPASPIRDSPVGEPTVDTSDLHLADLVSWFGGDKETVDEIVKGFKGNLFRTIVWAMRMSVDRNGYAEAPDYDKESDKYYGTLKTMPKLFSGFAKCQSYHEHNKEKHEVDRKKAAGEKFEKFEKLEESLNPCRMPGCLACYGHQLLKDLSALKNAFQSAPSGSTFEIRSSALPANFNSTSVLSKTGKPENAPILEAVTGRTSRVKPGLVRGDMRGKVRGSEEPGIRRTPVLRVTSLDAPTQGEVQEILGLGGEEHALIKRITAVSFTPFTRTPLSNDAVHAIGGQVLDLCRVSAKVRPSDGTTGSDHDNENVHRDLVSYVYPTPKVREVLPSGKKTDRFALVRSIFIDVDDRDSLKQLIEAYLFLNPPPFNAARGLREMEDDAETFMASVKAPNEKTHWVSGEFDDTSKVRVMKADERERRKATDPAAVHPKNFNQRPPDPDERRQQAEKKKQNRQHAIVLAEKNVLEDLEEKRLKEKLQNEKEAKADQARAPLRYQYQLDHLRGLRVSLSSLTVEQLLSDEQLDLTPLFRYVMGARHGLPGIMDANREGARAELLAYPVAREIFADQLGSL